MKRNLFLELCFDPKCRMNEVVRYSGVYQETVENLSEHITDVMMLSYLISKKLVGEEINYGELLEKCLLHDIEEVITGDIPRNTKYATSGIKKELDTLAVDSAKSILDNEQYILWSSSKDGKEGFILKIADFLTVAKKCMIEIEMRGNYSFVKVLSEVISFLNKFIIPFGVFEQEKSEEYLRDLIFFTRMELQDLHRKVLPIASKYYTLN